MTVPPVERAITSASWLRYCARWASRSSRGAKPKPSTSASTTRPSGPVAVTFAKSTFISFANLRAAGEAFTGCFAG